MNLVLDFGNTRIKAAVFKHDHLINNFVFDSTSDLIKSIGKFKDVTHCMVASVTSDHESVMPDLQAVFDTRLFATDTPVPLKNLYKSALTLGSDRLAVAVG